MDACVNGCRLTIIAAVATNGVIGRNNEIPWKLPEDMRRFARLTKHHMVIVGRNTYESIVARLGKPLPERGMIVVTSQVDYQALPGCIVVHSWEDALKRARGAGRVFVLGGERLYKDALWSAEEIFLTEVHATPEGDAFFPDYDGGEWEERGRVDHPADAKNEYPYSFVKLVRRDLSTDLGDRRAEGYMVLNHARADDQREVMERIAESGVCSFCPEHRELNDLMPTLYQGACWSVRVNRWPYKYTWLHLLIILERHAERISDLLPNEWDELRTIIAWAELTYEVAGGAIGIRFGDPRMNGATVDHLHVHFVVSEQDTTVEGYERPRFAMGPKAPERRPS